MYCIHVYMYTCINCHNLLALSVADNLLVCLEHLVHPPGKDKIQKKTIVITKLFIVIVIS